MSCSRRIGPDDRGLQRLAAVGVEVHGPLGAAVGLLIEIAVARRVDSRVGEERGRIGGIDQPPTVGIVGPGVAGVERRVDQHPFGRRAAGCEAELVLEMLDQQHRGSGHVGRRHRRAGQRPVIVVRTAVRRVQAEAVADHVGLDPAVVRGTVAGEAGRHDLRGSVRIAGDVVDGPHDEGILGIVFSAEAVVAGAGIAVPAGGGSGPGVGHQVPP